MTDKKPQPPGSKREGSYEHAAAAARARDRVAKVIASPEYREMTRKQRARLDAIKAKDDKRRA